MRSTARPTRGRKCGSINPALRGTLRTGAAGLLLGLAFLPLPLGFLAWFAFVPLLMELDERVGSAAPLKRLFTAGWLFGFVFYLTGTHWIALLADVAMTVPWIKYPAWLLAALYLSLYAGLATLLAGLLARSAKLPLAIGFPFAWLTIEELRASGELGFPWFQPGYTQHAYAPVIQLASLGSVSLVTLWVLAVNSLLWLALRGPARGRSAMGAILVLALPWAWGSRVIAAAPGETGGPVALIQGNIAGEMKWSGQHQREILEAYLGLSSRAMNDSLQPGIVIWPETATGTYLRQQPEQLIAVYAWTAQHHTPILAGHPFSQVDSTGRQRFYNAASVFEVGAGTSPVYAKRHLVPFGERMPFQSWFPAFGKFDMGQAEWTPGTEATQFSSVAGPFGVLVCFEAIFPDLARDDVRRGARWLVNITNDEWFGNGAALQQHAAMALFRAVENHVPLARCANTGLTLIADSNGRITHRLPVFAPGVIVARLSPPGLPTPFTRFGDWPGALAGIVVVAAAVRAFVRGKPGPR
jgi:apolipoprotein N-acyltransferase